MKTTNTLISYQTSNISASWLNQVRLHFCLKMRPGQGCVVVRGPPLALVATNLVPFLAIGAAWRNDANCSQGLWSW